MTESLSHPAYRPDIDGLRALAVLSVVVFHAFPAWLGGGFIGVDVFFVISGYLISSILFANLARHTLSLRAFYARRIRRIFPALLLVLAASYGVGWFTLLAHEYAQLGMHMAGGASFLSNYVLWAESGYFDNAADTKLLLHLWSLGIEEQFYIVYPCMLWLAWKARLNLLAVTAVLAAASLYLNLQGVHSDAVATFFSPQTRIWELLCGSLLAWLTLHGAAVRARLPRMVAGGHASVWSNAASLAGLLLLLYGFARFDKDLVFPGAWALVPVLGACLLIAAGPGAWFNRHVLANRVVVWFGLISFPLYLWHWVLLTFPRIIQGETPSAATRMAAVVLSIVLAWLTYRLVERPLRYGGNPRTKTQVLSLLMAMTLLVGYLTYAQGGLALRHDAQRQLGRQGDTGHVDFHHYIADRFFACTPENIARQAPQWHGYQRCMQSQSARPIDIALIGDSHAEHLFIGMAEALPDKNVVFYIQNSVPLLGNPEFAAIYRSVIQSPSIKTVVLTMHWTGRYRQIPDGTTLGAELIKVIDALTAGGKQVHLTDDVPAFPFDPEVCLGKRRFADFNACRMTADTAQSQRAVYQDALLDVVRERPAVQLLSVGQYLCDAAGCGVVQGDTVLYRDRNHLNIPGSLLVGRRLVEEHRLLFK